MALEIPVIFRNELPYEVDLYWEGRNKRVSQGGIQAGGEGRIQSHPGHIFSYDDNIGQRQFVKVPAGAKTETLVLLSSGNRRLTTPYKDSTPDYEKLGLQAEEQNDDDIPDVLVLVCTQSFTAEEFVEDILLDRLFQEKASWRVKVKLVDEAGIDWTESDKQQEALTLSSYARVVLVVASTYGDGDPPNHAAEFADWLARTNNNNNTADIAATAPAFAVFGLGDSSYAHFCAFGEFIDSSLAARGGERLLPFHTGDVLADQSGEFRNWCDRVVVALSKIVPGRVMTNNGIQRLPFSSTGSDWRRSAIQPGSVVAKFAGAENLLKEDASRSIINAAITLPTGLCPDDLQPGDHAGIYPRNNKTLVERALRWLDIDANTTTKILERRGESWVEKIISASELLTAHVDLAGRASPSVLRTLLPFVGTLELRALARDLTFVETKSSSSNTTVDDESKSSVFEDWVAGRRLTKLDLAMMFECRPSLQAFARSLGPMQPRLYSVATVNQTKFEQTIGLCISVAEGGLCTNYVANLAQGSDIIVFFRKSRFHFIPDGSLALMIAAGSGIGPYVGFLENELKRPEIANVSAPLSRIRLCYGCRSPSEILYEDRLSFFERHGSHVHYAFSRLFGKSKVYAQDLIRREMEKVWAEVFESQGRVFVCGRLEICDGVIEALVKVAQDRGGMQEEEARRIVQNMEKEGRLLTDCWSVDSYDPPQQPKKHSLQHPPHVVHRLERHHAPAASSQQTSQNQSSAVDVSKVAAWPSYLRLVASGELERRIENATNMYSACVSCGRFCEVNRLSDNPDDWGECRVGDKAIVSSADAHFGEEDCLRGTHGSGTIFFGACNLKCIYCQNWQLSMMDSGELVDDQRLAELMLMLQRKGCHNINFVSPTHNVLAILRAVLVAAKNGLKLPIVWNTGGYDSVASLRLLEDVVDIYLADAKYASRAVARKLSKVDNYPEINQAAIKEMHRQVGELQIDPRNGLAWRGVMVRHLILPSDYAGTYDVASFLAKEVSVNTFTNVMPQYRPEYQAKTDRRFGLNRKPSRKELQDAVQGAKCACLQRIQGEENCDCDKQCAAACPEW